MAIVANESEQNGLCSCCYLIQARVLPRESGGAVCDELPAVVFHIGSNASVIRMLAVERRGTV